MKYLKISGFLLLTVALFVAIIIAFATCKTDGALAKKYDEEKFLRVIRTGKRPAGSVIQFPIPWQNFSKMTDIELKALWKYLKS